MKNINPFVIITTIFCFMLISGCASQKEIMLQEGYPLLYAEGFDDGCHSGSNAGGSLFDQFKKDVRKFENDIKYAQGWSDAFRQCESKQEALDRQTRIGVEQRKLDEQKKHNKLQEKYHLERDFFKGVDTSNFKYLK